MAASGLVRIRVLTTQKRKCEKLQRRISRGRNLPITSHLARIGSTHEARNVAAPKTAERSTVATVVGAEYDQVRPVTRSQTPSSDAPTNDSSCRVPNIQ